MIAWLEILLLMQDLGLPRLVLPWLKLLWTLRWPWHAAFTMLRVSRETLRYARRAVYRVSSLVSERLERKPDMVSTMDSLVYSDNLTWVQKMAALLAASKVLAKVLADLC